jgi:hypothetical protein
VPARTFVVTVSESPERFIVEDVRSGRRAVGDDLADVGRQIAGLLEPAPEPCEDGPPDGESPRCERTVSGRD